MSTRRNIAGILSLVILFLLPPAFAAAGQRKAVKKAALPRLVSDGAAFRAFSKPAAGAGSTTAQGGGEASGAEVNGAQFTGGAGVSVGVGIIPASGGMTGANSSSKSPASGGQATGSAKTASVSGAPPQDCPSTTATIVPLQGHRIWKLGRGQSLAFEFTTGPNSVGEIDTVETADIAMASRYATFSTCPGDFSVKTSDWFVSGSALTAGLNYYTGEQKHPGFANLRPNTRYYFNIRHAVQSASGLVESCPTSWGETPVPYCAFWLEYSGDWAIGGVKPGGSTVIPASPECAPPPAMTAEEKMQWCINDPENKQVYGANVSTYCGGILSYISGYVKYPGLDVRGCPMTNNSLPCGGFSPCYQ